MVTSSILLIAALSTQAAPVASACASIGEYQLLSAWVGAWDVKTAAGQPAGSSQIERSPDGCGLIEHWLGRRPNGSAQPGTGLHAFDRASSLWRHLWVDASGFSAALVGKVESGRVVYERSSQIPGTIMRFHRMTLEPLGDRLIQTGEHSDDGQKTWSRDFQLTYVRRVA